MMRTRLALAALPVGLAALVALAGCGSGSGASSATASPGTSGTTGGGMATIAMTKNPQLGPILTDSKGNTVYVFAKDSKGMSNCNGACASRVAAGDNERQAHGGQRRPRLEAGDDQAHRRVDPGHLRRAPAVHLHGGLEPGRRHGQRHQHVSEPCGTRSSRTARTPPPAARATAHPPRAARPRAAPRAADTAY